MQVKVSVCIPVYGVEKYIERCARSLFEQTMQEGIEFIFVNDCTPDKSVEVLERVLEDYPHRKNQVKLIHHEVNQGIGVTRQTLLRHASGEYIIYCDSDDWVDLDYYESLYQVAVSTDADVVYTPYVTHFGDAQSISSLPVCNQADVFLQNVLDHRFHWGLWNKMFRSNVLLNPQIDCPTHICFSEDLLRLSQVLLFCKKVNFVNDVYYHYFKGNPNAETKNFSRRSLEYSLEVIRILKNKLPPQFTLDTAFCFILFLGIIYNLFTAKEFQNNTKWISFKSIWKCNESCSIRGIVCLAMLSYRVTSLTCYLLLNVRKWIRNQRLKKIKI